MNINNVSLILMISTALIWGFYDVYLYYRLKNYGDNTRTLSQLITAFSWYSPMLPFILGLLMGHWLW